MAEDKDETVKIGLGVWLSVCLLMCLWLIRGFTRGRQQFHNNLHVIEDGLKRMQESIELEQRKKSMGYVENMEEITGFLDSLSEHSADKKYLVSQVMKHQKVTVDLWKMVSSSCSYLALAFCVWLFLRLSYACFWLPGYLQTQEAVDDSIKVHNSDSTLMTEESREILENSVPNEDGGKLKMEDKKTI